MSSVITAARLVDGATELVIIPSSGMGVRSIEIGLPSARAVTTPRTDVDGERDTTARFGSRAVSMSFHARRTAGETPAGLQDGLHYFLAPNRRPYLIFTMDGQVERRILLRPDSGSMSFTRPRNMLIDSVAQWVAPDGIIEAQAESEQSISAAADTEAGRSYDLSFDRSYPASNPVGVATITNDGNADAWPVIKLYGPCDDPQVENQTTGEQLLMSGITVAAGDYLEVDMRERTIRLNSVSSQSRLQYLDFESSAWWPLVPGDNSVRYFPSSFSAGAAAVVTFRHSWL